MYNSVNFEFLVWHKTFWDVQKDKALVFVVMKYFVMPPLIERKLSCTALTLFLYICQKYSTCVQEFKNFTNRPIQIKNEKSAILLKSASFYLVQLIRTTNTNLEFLNEIFVYLLVEFFYKVKVSVEIKIHHKMPI